MLLHYLVHAFGASCTWNRWPTAPRYTILYSAGPVASMQISQIWTQSITKSGLSCNIVSTRQKSVAWMNGGRSTSGVALNSRLWLLTTSLEDFERASIRKEDNSNTTCELTILILSVSVTFSVTFVWLLPCYICHSKSVHATSTIRPTRVFVLQGSATAKSGYGRRFYSTLGHRYLMSDIPKKILKSDSNCQSYSKCYRGTLFDLQFHVHDALSAFTR